MAFGSVIERNVTRPLMRLVTMGGAPIMQQLHLEERLLRRTSDNWCIVNDGTAPPTIVMGVSGKVSELVEIQPVLRDHVPVIRRFSGGGTVIVDQGTVFVTFICNKTAVDGLQPFPRDIMSWTGQLYGKVFRGFGEFHLRENDYAFSHRKFGGNAQSITKDRWVHHTSFLWDYDYMPSRSVFTEGIIGSLGDHFTVQRTELETVLSEDDEFVPSTKLLSPQDLQDIMSSKESLTVQRVQGWPRS
uniref:Uncharacterized protein n=1 Tax=Avena sativa TaxID=4498 RepID=A0ACD5V1T6_AVESA